MTIHAWDISCLGHFMLGILHFGDASSLRCFMFELLHVRDASCVGYFLFKILMFTYVWEVSCLTYLSCLRYFTLEIFHVWVTLFLSYCLAETLYAEVTSCLRYFKFGKPHVRDTTWLTHFMVGMLHDRDTSCLVLYIMFGAVLLIVLSMRKLGSTSNG